MGLKKFDFFFVGWVFGVMGVFQCASVWRRKREDSVWDFLSFHVFNEAKLGS
jgi:hypothetical protein